MSLLDEVRTVASQAKRAPESIDLGELRSLLLRVEEVLGLFVDVSKIATTLDLEGSECRTLTVVSTIDSTARPFWALDSL